MEELVAGKTLTDYELDALSQEYNLADGHAQQALTLGELNLVNQLGRVYLAAQKLTQEQVQQGFLEAFFELAGQKSYKSLDDPLIHFSSSVSIEIIANFLRIAKLQNANRSPSVALIHPTFDNIPSILRRHNIKLIPLEEDDITYDHMNIAALDCDAVFLVCPNNPTGLEISRDTFLNISRQCAISGKLLVVDFSFRFFSSFTEWDQYKTLMDEGVDFIAIEDTGKAWSTLDLKAGIIVCSKSIYPIISRIHNDILLRVSPFLLLLLTHFLSLTMQSGLHGTLRATVDNNRKYLRSHLKNTPLMTPSDSKISVEWITLPGEWKSTSFCSWLQAHRIFILPGEPFCWANYSLGTKHIRVALMRSEELFRRAVDHFVEVLDLFKAEEDHAGSL